MAWIAKSIRIICRCRRGRHRSVAAVSLLRKLFHLLSPATFHFRKSCVNVLAGRTAPSGQCVTCAADNFPVEMRQYLFEIKDMLPYSENVDEVRQ